MRQPKGLNLGRGQKLGVPIKKTLRLGKRGTAVLAKKGEFQPKGSRPINAVVADAYGKYKGGGRRKKSLKTGSQLQGQTLPEATVFTRFLNTSGFVAVDEVAEWFGISQGQLAETVGVRPETFHRFARVTATKTQNRVKEMLEIVARITEWSGGKDQALAWYRAMPIPAFGGRTAESLVKDGKATEVRDYLDSVALGGFA